MQAHALEGSFTVGYKWVYLHPNGPVGPRHHGEHRCGAVGGGWSQVARTGLERCTLIRVILVDDHPVVREGVRARLEAEADIEVVAEADTGEGALALLDDVDADLWLLDITLPGLNGIDLTRTLRSSERSPRVIILSMHRDRAHVVPAFEAGANGYLVKSNDGGVVLQAVKSVACGKSFVCAEVADLLLQHAVGGGDSLYSQLTQRERQVLQLVAEGMNAKEIADPLGISDKTVHAFRARVMRKLKVHSIAGLTKYAIRHGLTPLD